VLGLVMKEGAVLIAAGSAIGLAAAWAGIRALSGFLSVIARTAGTSTADPALLLGAPLLLAALALVCRPANRPALTRPWHCARNNQLLKSRSGVRTLR
jgi:hypothetical protein